MYKTQLPFILAFNKTDIEDCGFAVEWMTDFEAFQEACCHGEDNEQESYIDSLTKSMGLVLDEFYQTLRVTGVSAMTGYGMDEFFGKVQEATVEYET